MSVRVWQLGSEEGAQLQLVDELKATSRDVRQRILKEAGITPEIVFGDGLAMKADLYPSLGGNCVTSEGECEN